MQHLGTKTLYTKRLTLRRFTPEDAEAMFQNWANDPDVTRFLTWPVHKSPEESRALLREWCPNYADVRYYHWAIVYGQPIGSIGAVRLSDQLELAHIGYCIGKRWWRQGGMSEALQAVIDFFLREVGLNRVEARHDPRNPHSGGVMRKCGMQYEGTLRQADRNNQGLCDAAMYALLARDYFAASAEEK